jgi:nicotinamide-nucleotide amidase
VGGIVAYDNAVKIDMLGVAQATLQRTGAVSEETALEMALGARARLGSDVAVSTTGVAGPTGGSPDKPVGLVWLGLAGLRGTRAVKLNLVGDRAAIQRRATIAALALLWNSLQ